MSTAAGRYPLAEFGYRLLMRRNSVYIAFILGGALVGERVLNKGFDLMWEENNKGKLFKHMTIPGQEGGEGGEEE